jgi:hypothetical protein
VLAAYARCFPVRQLSKSIICQSFSHP